MKLAIIFLVALAAAAPPVRKLIVKSNHFPDQYLIYAGNHDIVDIAAPPIKPFSKLDERMIAIFFVEADIKDNGDKDYKGLYIFNGNETKHILANGQSVTYAKDYNAYFGANDGIYKYNENDNSAQKVGNVTDSVVKMTIDTNTELIYYLTEDHVLYKFNTSKDESTKIEAVKDARDIIFDSSGNMFFYDGGKQVYVADGDSVLKIEGLPSGAKKVAFIKNPFFMTDVFVIVDSAYYKINRNGTSEGTIIEFEAQPTAFSLDYAVFQYYAYNKKIYRYRLNVFDLIGFARSQQ